MYDTPEARDLAPEDRWDKGNENGTKSVGRLAELESFQDVKGVRCSLTNTSVRSRLMKRLR